MMDRVHTTDLTQCESNRLHYKIMLYVKSSMFQECIIISVNETYALTNRWKKLQMLIIVTHRNTNNSIHVEK